MYRTPPPDDEQPDYTQTPTVYPRQRRRRPRTTKGGGKPCPYSTWSNGETRAEASSRPYTIRRAGRGQATGGGKDGRKVTSLPPLHGSQQRQQVTVEEETVDETLDESEYEADVRAYQRDSRKIIVTQRRRSPIYEPRTALPDHRTRHRQSRSPGRGHYLSPRQGRPPLPPSRSSHRAAVLITCLFLLAILILVSIAYFAIRAQIRPGVSSTSSGLTSGPSSSSSSASLPINPHELIITPEDSDHPSPPVFATAAYLLDADTGATLYAHNPFMHLPMMSTTKLMTAVLAVEQGKPDQKITITGAMEHDISQLSAGSTVFGLKRGETYTLRELLYGLLLLSGNDAAIAIADALGGNLPHFVAQMNSRAHQLGLLDTHYLNPHGLSETGHYSSARDLAVLGQYSLSIPLIHQISGTQTYIIPQTATHPEHDLLNGNQFLWWYPGVDGGKTGYDGGSNFVQVISCTRNHHHLIGVTIHTINWWTDMRDLMNWGFDNFKWISPRDVDSQQNPIPFDNAWNYFASDTKEKTVGTADQG